MFLNGEGLTEEEVMPDTVRFTVSKSRKMLAILSYEETFISYSSTSAPLSCRIFDLEQSKSIVSIPALDFAKWNDEQVEEEWNEFLYYDEKSLYLMGYNDILVPRLLYITNLQTTQTALRS